MKNTMFRKYIATLLAVMLIFFPTIQPFADDMISGNQQVVDGHIVDSIPMGGGLNPSTSKKTVTLITGDVVTVTDIGGGKSFISVEPVSHVNEGIQIIRSGKDTFVFPREAMPYIASDLLDRDLFNITALIAAGYDDENQSTLPVIVQYDKKHTRFKFALSTTLEGSEQVTILESIGGVALSTDKKQAKMFWEDVTEFAAIDHKTAGVIKKIWLDGRVEATLAESVPQIGAPEAWENEFDGTGVTVAVLDTGLDETHRDFEGQVDEVMSFVPGEDAVDHNGHGTHVASTVLGTGAASDGRNKGVAPNARLIVGKVLSNDGYGQDSWVIKGMEWAAKNAKIINMSLGDSNPSDGNDPLSQAVNELSEQTGALFVISAGNTGSEGIGSPGAADAALTVGNVTKQDRLAGSSSRGPRYMESGLKPDLTAPGSAIVAARASLSDKGSGLYLSLTGTSMAAPHVAGAAAILSQRYPDWTGEQLKQALMSSTKKIDSIKPYQGGSGRLDVAAATFGTIFASGSLDFGFFDWPHEDDAPVVKTVTYTNVGDEEVVLDLSTTFTDNSNKPAPEGLLELSADQVTVPANGSVEVTLTVNPNLAEIANRYQGHLTAAVNGEKVAHTAMAMGKEDERQSLTINVTNPDGTPGNTLVTLVGKNHYPTAFAVFGTKELRLPPDTYSVLTLMDIDMNTDHAGVAFLGNPEVVLDKPQTVELDARNVSEITATAPQKTEAAVRKLEYYRNFGGENMMGETYIIPPMIDKIYAQSTEVIESGVFELNMRWRLMKPLMDIKVGEEQVESLLLPGSTLFEGKHELEVVYAGKGTEMDYKDIDAEGKAVLVERSDLISGSERADNAIEAGAKLLIIVNDGPTKFIEWVGNDNDGSDNPIAAVSVSGTAGKALIESAVAKKLSLSVVGTLESPYLYDLIDNHPNAVPKDLTYAPSEDELVKIDVQYYSDRPVEGSEWRIDIPSYNTGGDAVFMHMKIPTKRTEWVTASESTTWFHMASMVNKWEVRGIPMKFEPGQKIVEKWFAPIVRPYIGEGYWKPFRINNNLQFNIPAWADAGKGHTGHLDADNTQTMALYQGDTKLRETKSQTLNHNGVLEENTQYRLVVDASRNPEEWSTSIRTHTEWTFWTKKQEEFITELPMISLNFDVETDLSGNAIAGDKIMLGMSAAQVSTAKGNGKIEGASLEVSFDEGKSWEAVELTQEGDGWIAEISNSHESGTFVSIRASAWDDLGNKIEQEIIKAFGISDSTVSLISDKDSYSLQTGSTQQIKVEEVTTPKGDGEPTKVDVSDKAEYFVKDEEVATVKAGLIKAIAKGSTEVVISYGGQELTVNVTVTDAYVPGPGPSPDPTPTPNPDPVDPKPETPLFTDIINTFAKDEINKLAAKGIIQGKTETEFAPNAQITRAEFTVLVVRALGLPLKSYEGKFADVNKSKKWAYAGIEAAAEVGIVNGTKDGKFSPDAPIKREEIAAMVVRAIEYKNKVITENLDKPANFKDHSSIGAYAIDLVYKATALGVIKGNDGHFNPKNNATRAEAAVMLYRALDSLKLLD
ncbi:S8 family serine peptidase [Sporosarcina highlanderae]|uniref:S8 family serine peptidase n=1 Tax=Sporosarcina highlanderae TaxID=3035916 RepID=A0ABT8JSU6_9BACL|nr:S8 family serine peptidase [Sporosarcina highlanderae]MDN4608067.1 S8 family serine peptidase [Sporosarcina highlanderae]